MRVEDLDPEAQELLKGVLSAAYAQGYNDGIAAVATQYQQGQEWAAVLGSETDPTPLEDLDLTLRTHTILTRAQLHTVGAVVRYGKARLLGLPNFNQECLNEFEAKLAARLAALRGNDDVKSS